MNLKNDNVIGIVGGMGPQAGLALFSSIVANTNAATDQQHLPVILMSLSQYIVDRTSFLEGKTKINPAENILEIIKKMVVAGARIIGMACNTSYSPEIYDVIKRTLHQYDDTVSLLNMPLETCEAIGRQCSHGSRVGLMATNGTYRSKVYENLLRDFGYDVILPDVKLQNDVIHKMIYDPVFGIKANPKLITEEVHVLLRQAIDFFNFKKADAVILGCTELSLTSIDKFPHDFKIIDSTEVMAKALIREATRDCTGKTAMRN